VSSNGISINNPANLRYDGTKWQGLADPPDHDGFCVFADPLHGLRAAMLNLRNYQVLHGIHTLRAAIQRHAPPSENPTDNYLNYVSVQSGFSPDVALDFDRAPTVIPVIKAMCEFENGPSNVTYTDQIYMHAAEIAGLT
jgi:hypothetical protein